MAFSFQTSSGPARPPMRLLTREKTQRFMSFRCLPSVKTLQRAGMGLPLPSKHLKPLAVMDGAAPRFNKYQQRPLPFQGSCFRSGRAAPGWPGRPSVRVTGCRDARSLLFLPKCPSPAEAAVVPPAQAFHDPDLIFLQTTILTKIAVPLLISSCPSRLMSILIKHRT